MKYFDLKNPILKIGDILVTDILKTHSTPLYLYDLKIIEKQHQLLKKNLPNQINILYSVKANPNINICSALKRLGTGAEIASSGELYIAIQAGFSPDQIVFDGPGKTKKDMEYAIKTGIKTINAESIEELKTIDRIAGGLSKKVDVCLRINPIIHGNNAKMHTAGGAQKFGTDQETAYRTIQTAMKLKNICFCGIHVYIGSQIFDHKLLADTLSKTIDYALEASQKLGFELKQINLGGGLGIPYNDSEKPFDIISFGKLIKETIDAKKALLQNTQFFMEIGRYLTSESGIYLTKIIDIKKSRGETFVIVDGGINHSFLPIIMNKNYPTLIVNKLAEKKTTLVNIGGTLCTSIDMFSKKILMPKPEIDDVIAIFNSGAYGFSASMLYFLSHPLPAEVIIKNGKTFLARSHGKKEDFMINQIKIIE